MMGVLVRLTLSILWCGSGVAVAAREHKVMCLDMLHPLVQSEYRLLERPHDWNDEVLVRSEDTSTTGSAYARKQEVEEAEEQLKLNHGYQATDLNHYILLATYDFRIPSNISLEDSKNTSGRGLDGVVYHEKKDESKRKESRNTERVSLLSTDNPNGFEGHSREETGREGLDNDMFFANKEHEVTDMFDIDFTLFTSEITVPCWWVSGGSSKKESAFLTVALVGGDFLEDSDSREEQIREKYGDYVFRVARAHERKVESKGKKKLADAVEDAGDKATIPETVTRVNKVWAAIEELRSLWRSKPAARFVPHTPASSQSRHQHYYQHNSDDSSTTGNSSSETQGAGTPDALLMDDSHKHREQMKNTRRKSKKTGHCCGRQASDDTHPHSPVPFTAIYSPTNISDEVFPGSLPESKLKYHLRFPSTSPWHSFRHAVDFHMLNTGVLYFPLLTAATYHLPLHTCFPSDLPVSTDDTRFNQRSRSRTRNPNACKEGKHNAIPVDVSPLLQAWLQENPPWKRHTSKMSLVMFTATHNSGHHIVPNTSTHDSQNKRGSELEIQSTVSAPVPALHTVLDTSSSNSPLQDDNRPAYSPLQPNMENDSHRAKLDALLSASPPRLSLDYWLDGKWTHYNNLSSHYILGDGDDAPEDNCSSSL
nr:uncharacterized protein LOC128703837 [Cherax quadricarinatus]